MATCQVCGHSNRGSARFCEACGGRLDGPLQARERRKVVTVLFCDVTGSTQLGERLDPETLRELLAGYFERMRVIVERHGGSVEKFIGDAVMAVFGVPVLHEDDALRAVRAAVEMRDALPELGLRGRIGVTTGEVVAGTEERLATGDAVNVAARLEQAAEPGEVLIGAPTLALVGELVEVEPLAPLDLKGKADPVLAHRLLGVRDAPERRHEVLFVGRAREFALLREAWDRVRDEQRCELMTVVGDAGVGKSRLAVELLASIEATIVRGRCLPYGEGITYWPVVEVLKQLALLPPDEVAAAAVRSLVGEAGAPTSPDEMAWAFRKTLEHAAAEQPLAVVFDDIQWGEETFLDLVEHVALLSAGAPILLLCLARPEIVERRSAWPVTLRLEPLTDESVDQFIPARIAGDLREKIARAAGGNPLFIQEMLAMAGEADGEIVVPPTLRALLGARLDQLDAAERSVLERGSIEGEVFHRGAVQALAPEETQVSPHLASLVRKALIRSEKAQLPGEDGFRFRHLLIRDAAYDALPKATRADLHQRFASWLETHGTELVELDEIIAYHLEHAWRYRRELGHPQDAALAMAARERLTASTQRAMKREDYAAAAALAERALALVPAAEVHGPLEIDRNEAVALSGRIDAHHDLSKASIERAHTARDRPAELAIRINMATWETLTCPEGAIDRLDALVDEALPELETLGDDYGLYNAYFARAHIANWRGQAAKQVTAIERSLAYARQSPERHDTDFVLEYVAEAHFLAPTPAAEVLAWLDQHASDRRLAFRLRRAATLAMLGRAHEALDILNADRKRLQEQQNRTELGMSGQLMAFIARRAGEIELAERILADACRFLEALGERGVFSTAAARRSVLLAELGRLDEAEASAANAFDAGASDDILTHLIARRCQAKVLARRGDHDTAEQHAREAVRLVLTTDFPNEQADTYIDLADVLERAGRHEDAAESLQTAITLHQSKGDIAGVAQAQSRLDACHQ